MARRSKESGASPEALAALEQKNPVMFERIKLVIAEKGLESERDIKDVIFKEMVIAELVNQFVAELSSVGFSDEEKARLAVMFYEQKDENFLTEILAIPWEQRQFFYSQMKPEDKTAEFLFNKLKFVHDKLAEISKDQKPPIMGFHNSAHDLKPEKSRVGARETIAWQIHGSEISDLATHEGKIAFAYDNFHGKYTEKEFNYVYIVRISDREKQYRQEEGHYWQTSFPIVAKINKDPLFDNVEKLYRQMTQPPQAA